MGVKFSTQDIYVMSLSDYYFREIYYGGSHT
jgi:hypothetical protein